MQEGTQLGSYRIEAPIGAGGMGKVYRARDLTLDRSVAIKVLPDEYQQEGLARFRREARLLAATDHANICAIHAFGEEDGRPYIVMELLQGATLRRRLREERFGVRRALKVARQVADALEEAHAHAIVHRDLKPANIVLESRDRVKVLDFGLARSLGIDAGPGASRVETAVRQLTRPGTVVGTWPYMSPEQVRGREVDQRSDIWSFGCVLYEMLAGRPAFDRETPADTLAAVLEQEPDWAALSAETPPAIRALLHRTLRKDPDQRLHDIADARIEIEDELAETSTQTSGAPPTPSTAGAREITQRALPWGFAAALLVAVIAVFGIGQFLPLGNEEQTPVDAFAPPPRIVPFLKTGAAEKNPAWSPQDNLVAFVSNAAGNDDVWITDASGSNPSNLTTDNVGIDDFPTWSRDGQLIAFYSERDGPGIYTMTVMGGQVRKLTAVSSSVHYVFSLRTAPGGDLVFSDRDDRGVPRVYRIGWQPGTRECLTCSHPDAALGGDIHPSADYLVFSGPDASDLFLTDLATGSTRCIFRGLAWSPVWSRAGGSVLFLSEHDNRTDLWELPFDATTGVVGEARRRTSGQDLGRISVDSTGDRALGVGSRSTDTIWALPADAENMEGLEQGRHMTPGDHRDFFPRWLPDGDAFLFLSDRRGGLDVWRGDIASGSVVRVTDDELIKGRLAPSPTGEWVAYDERGHGGLRLTLMRPDGSNAHPILEELTSEFDSFCCADWSPDGTRLVLNGAPAEGGGLVLLVADIDIATGMTSGVSVHDVPGTLEEFARWSPDGRWIVYEVMIEDSWDLWLIDQDGGKPRRLTAEAGNERGAAWAADGRAVFYVKDLRNIWKITLDEDGQAVGPPGPWLSVPSGATAWGMDVLDHTMLVTVRVNSSDIHLIELVGR